MFYMPDAFKEENEDYVTIPVLKKFIRKSGEISGRLSVERKSLINYVVDYANTSLSAEHEVADWVDCVAKEGIKDVYIKKINIEQSGKLMNNVNEVAKLVEPLLGNIENRHFCCNNYDDELKLVRCDISENEPICYSFYFGKMVFIYDGKKMLKARLYPIFIDLYPEQEMIVGRAKPKQNMFIYNNGKFNEDNMISLDSESEIMRAIDCVSNLLNIKTKSTLFVKNNFKEKLYELLEQYTTTPNEINQLISENRIKIESVIKTISRDICKLNCTDDLEQDICNLVEKYFSITYPNKKIFMDGRAAYPLRIAATDEEESKVDQRSCKEDPLQSKAVFFDNKKMIQKNKKCDSIFFMFQRILSNKLDDFFKVRFIVKRDYCLLKFTEYTEEVDIQNVLLLFISD